MRKKPGPIVIIRLIMAMILIMLQLTLIVVGMAIANIVTLGRYRDSLFQYAASLFGKTGLYLTGVDLNVRYHGEKPAGPVVYLFNHSSTLDLFVISSLRLPNIRYIAKQELGYNPFFWAMAKMSGQIMINRKDPRKALEQINKAYRFLRKNSFSIAFAPEGTRSSTGKIGPFKMGAFHAAVDLGYPVIPLFIEGAYALCPGKSLIIQPGTVTIHFHKPVDTSGWDKKTIRKHSDEIRELYLKWNGETNRERRDGLETTRQM